MGSFTLLMHKGCKVAHVYFCLFFFSACVPLFFLILQRCDVGSFSTHSLSHRTNVIFLPMHLAVNTLQSSLRRKVKKPCIFQRQLKHEILMSTANSPHPSLVVFAYFTFAASGTLFSTERRRFKSIVLRNHLPPTHQGDMRKVGRRSAATAHPLPSRRLLKSSQWSCEQEEKTASSSTLSPSLYCLQQSQFINPKRKERGERRAKKRRRRGRRRRGGAGCEWGNAASRKASQSSFEFHLIFLWELRCGGGEKNQLWSTPEYYFEHPATHSPPGPLENQITQQTYRLL